MADQEQNYTFQIKKNIIRARLGKYTKKAFMLLPDLSEPCILDLGCGSGVPSIELAKISNGYIFGMDTDEKSFVDEAVSSGSGETERTLSTFYLSKQIKLSIDSMVKSNEELSKSNEVQSRKMVNLTKALVFVGIAQVVAIAVQIVLAIIK